MWNTNAINPSVLHPASLISGPELQALLHQPFETDHKQRQPFGLMPPKSQPVSPWHAGENLILASLPPFEQTALAPHLERVTLTSGQVIVQPGQALQHVYFPTHSSLSWVSHTADGESAELALVGRDGLVGVPWVLGGMTMQHTVQVQCGGQALRMSADEFVRQLRRPGRLHQLALLYVQWQMTQMAQSIVCSRHHAVSERLGHWLLSNAQGANTRELRVTHETISQMLGVRRESVTQAAGRFQAAGWIENHRGRITLKDPDGLSSMACECHARSQVDSKRYLQQLAQQGRQHDGDAHAVASPAPVDAAVVLTPYGMPQEEQESQASDLQKYVDAYDFAPVGFVTLDVHGRVLQTNLAGAILLDIPRSQCQHHQFSDFLEPASQASFAQFHQEVLGGQCRRYCLVVLTATAHRDAMCVRIDATADEWGVENRMVLIDVSDQLALQEGVVAPWASPSTGSSASPLGYRL
ncbi:MAG: helix-turn-helix domain-containing protein [Limnohabitans sp.]|jgi:CRP-like cAMP-binding protein|uniref:helix-turn-helix domain-containing protein n=1 Tax=Limnohabitans sp. TaxID=1907725 RepID=UPI003919661E